MQGPPEDTRKADAQPRYESGATLDALVGALLDLSADFSQRKEARELWGRGLRAHHKRLAEEAHAYASAHGLYDALGLAIALTRRVAAGGGFEDAGLGEQARELSQDTASRIELAVRALHDAEWALVQRTVHRAYAEEVEAHERTPSAPPVP